MKLFALRLVSLKPESVGNYCLPKEWFFSWSLRPRRSRFGSVSTLDAAVSGAQLAHSVLRSPQFGIPPMQRYVVAAVLAHSTFSRA